jgi:hypothetical protein
MINLGEQSRPSAARAVDNGCCMPPVLYTVGHSNRRFEDLVALLGEFGIRSLADVRSSPDGPSRTA